MKAGAAEALQGMRMTVTILAGKDDDMVVDLSQIENVDDAARHLIGAFATQLLSATSASDREEITVDVSDNFEDNREAIKNTVMFWCLKFFKFSEGNGIGEADLIVHSGAFGKRAAKLYLFYKLKALSSEVVALQLQTRSGRGLEGLPKDEKVGYVRVISPGQSRYIEDSLPALHIHGRRAEPALTLSLMKQSVSYNEFMAPAYGWFDESSMRQLAHYIESYDYSFIKELYAPPAAAPIVASATTFLDPQWRVHEAVGDIDQYMQHKW